MPGLMILMWAPGITGAGTDNRPNMSDIPLSFASFLSHLNRRDRLERPKWPSARAGPATFRPGDQLTVDGSAAQEQAADNQPAGQPEVCGQRGHQGWPQRCRHDLSQHEDTTIP